MQRYIPPAPWIGWALVMVDPVNQRRDWKKLVGGYSAADTIRMLLTVTTQMDLGGMQVLRRGIHPNCRTIHTREPADHCETVRDSDWLQRSIVLLLQYSPGGLTGPEMVTQLDRSRQAIANSYRILESRGTIQRKSKRAGAAVWKIKREDAHGDDD